MKVLLIEPAKSPLSFGGEEVFLFEPLALEYLAAGVARDHDVRILDLRVGDSLDATLDEFSPDVVGVTAYTVHVKPVHRICSHIKARDPEVLTVVGGHHATVAPGDFVAPDIDVVVQGEGVAPFQELVNRHERGLGFDDIAGVSVRNGSRLIHGPQQPLPCLDRSPLPLRSLTAPHRHRYFSEWMKPLASMRTSKGCPFRCSFCAQWKIAQGRYLRRKNESVLEELAEIDERFVFFADDESLVDVTRMEALAREITAAGLDKQFFMYGRSDTIARNRGLVELWRRAGLERVFVGLEFFRDDDLRYVHKGSSVSDNQRAVEILSDLGIDIYASFIVRPEFQHADFDALHRYCRELGLDFASFAVLTPLPGTDLYDDVKDQLLTTDPDYFDFIHTVLPTALPIDEFFHELGRLYRSAIPLGRQLSLLRKFPVTELPALFSRSAKVFRRMKTMHLDYADAA
jgi:radical SAM superfamily enzyme YgiQ (UPF0313 family)